MKKDTKSEGEPQFKPIQPAEWLDEIITKAATMKASDIHLEPSGDVMKVSFRIDGNLQQIDSLPIDYMEMVISRLKVIANLDITERRRPQDGHILFQPRSLGFNEPIDLRLSIFPTVLGEVAVMRILNRKDLLFEKLERLGVDDANAVKLKLIFQQSYGMVLVTGPGGSGKTTTLYTILSSLISSHRNIITLEDPVELRLKGIRQAQINAPMGFDFASGLRSILRQDPNVVMVGEIRDDETAAVSIRAALMGALFFSTMHTTNSVGAIVRFLELGIQKSLVASAMRLVIAQRLIRLICPYCRTEYNPPPDLLQLVNKFYQVGVAKFFMGKGCDSCLGTGYLGRTGIFEILYVDKDIQRLIIEGAPFTEIEALAIKKGMSTLKEEAMKKAIAGTSTLEEVFRITPLE